MIKNSFMLPETKEINLIKLDKEITRALGWKRHKKLGEDKECFSGLELDNVGVAGTWYKRILIIWTKNGIDGYAREDLTPEEESAIYGVINKHNG